MNKTHPNTNKSINTYNYVDQVTQKQICFDATVIQVRFLLDASFPADLQNLFLCQVRVVDLVHDFLYAEGLKAEENPYSARYDDGKLYYEGSLFNRRDRIIIENKDDTPVV